jgi:hypothetical protein
LPVEDAPSLRLACGQLRLKPSCLLDSGDHLINRACRPFETHAGFILRPIDTNDFHACKPLQGLSHFPFATPSCHPCDQESDLLGFCHAVLLFEKTTHIRAYITLAGSRVFVGPQVDSRSTCATPPQPSPVQPTTPEPAGIPRPAGAAGCLPARPGGQLPLSRGTCRSSSSSP